MDSSYLNSLCRIQLKACSLTFVESVAPSELHASRGCTAHAEVNVTSRHRSSRLESSTAGVTHDARLPVHGLLVHRRGCKALFSPVVVKGDLAPIATKRARKTETRGAVHGCLHSCTCGVMKMGDWLIDEESELLGDTLSLLASWDERHSISDTSSQGDTPVASGRSTRAQFNSTSEGSQAMVVPAKKPKTKTPRRVNSTRERLKGEIEMLRMVSTQLQDQLHVLQQRRAELLKPHFAARGIQTMAPIWENMARRQFQSRRRTEEYNARLRGQISEQAQVARELIDAVQFAMLRQTLQDKRPRLRLPMDVSLRLSEEQQLQRLEENFPRWQWALALSPKFQQGELQFVDLDVIKEGGKSATLELYTSQALPYSIARIADVTWRMSQQETSGFGEDEDDEKIDKCFQQVKANDDTLVGEFTMDSTMGGAAARQGTVHGKWVAKQAAIHDGTQHLVSSTWQYELEGFGNELDGVSVLEDTWLRIITARDIGHSQALGGLSVLQQVRQLQIQFNRAHHVDRRHSMVVTELLMKQLETELQAHNRALENALMGSPMELQ